MSILQWVLPYFIMLSLPGTSVDNDDSLYVLAASKTGASLVRYGVPVNGRPRKLTTVKLQGFPTDQTGDMIKARGGVFSGPGGDKYAISSLQYATVSPNGQSLACIFFGDAYRANGHRSVQIYHLPTGKQRGKATLPGTFLSKLSIEWRDASTLDVAWQLREDYNTQKVSVSSMMVDEHGVTVKSTQTFATGSNTAFERYQKAAIEASKLLNRVKLSPFDTGTSYKPEDVGSFLNWTEGAVSTDGKDIVVGISDRKGGERVFAVLHNEVKVGEIRTSYSLSIRQIGFRENVLFIVEVKGKRSWIDLYSRDPLKKIGSVPGILVAD